MDFSKIDNIEIDGIDKRDYPDFCDAFISSCDIDGVPATEDELEIINDDSCFVHEQVFKQMY